MSTEIKIPKTLNEHILSKCNLDYPESAPAVVGTVPVTYAKAISDHEELEKKLDKDFKEQDKVTKEFVKKNTGIDLNKKEKVNESMKHNDDLRNAANKALDALENLYDAMTLEADVTEDEISDIGFTIDTVTELLSRMSNKTVKEDVATLERERTYEPKDKASDLLGNQLTDDKEILWMRVYDELSADTGSYMKDMKRKVKSKRGERYKEVYPDADGIIVWETSPDRFDFAKRVANEYGLRTSEPREHKYPTANPYYKWSMKLYI